jgi:hypothetical protein
MPRHQRWCGQPKLSRKPSSGTRKRGTSAGRDGNHEGHSAEGGRRLGGGIPKSRRRPNALAPIGCGAWQAPRGRSTASRTTAPTPRLGHEWGAALPAAGQGDLEGGAALVSDLDHLQDSPARPLTGHQRLGLFLGHPVPPAVAARGGNVRVRVAIPSAAARTGQGVPAPP